MIFLFTSGSGLIRYFGDCLSADLLICKTFTRLWILSIQIWAFGRRAIASASIPRKARTVNRIRSHHSASAKARKSASTKLRSPPSPRLLKRQKLDNLTDLVLTPQAVVLVSEGRLEVPPSPSRVTLLDIDASTQPMIINSPQLAGIQLVHERRGRLNQID